TSCQATYANAEQMPLTAPSTISHGRRASAVSAPTPSAVMVTSWPAWARNNSRRDDTRSATEPAGRLASALCPARPVLAPLARDLGHQGGHRLGLLMACIAVGSVAEVSLVSRTGRRVRISHMVRVCYFVMCVVLLALGGAFVLVVVAVVLLGRGLGRAAGPSR